MTSTRALLAGGVISGPLFTAVTAAQMLTRAGFDPKRHPISLLGLGDPRPPRACAGPGPARGGRRSSPSTARP